VINLFAGAIEHHNSLSRLHLAQAHLLFENSHSLSVYNDIGHDVCLSLADSTRALNAITQRHT
jgi:hypothetical protein